MALRNRRGAFCAALLTLALAPAASADTNVFPVAGGGSSTAESAGALEANLGATSADSPQSVAFLRDYAYVYTSYVVADSERCRVRRVTFNAYNDTDIGTINTIAGNGTCGGSFQPTNTTATSYALGYPRDVSALADGTMSADNLATGYPDFPAVLIADSTGNLVDMWWEGSSGSTLRTVAGSGQTPCATPTDGTAATSAKFCNVTRVAAHPTDPRDFLVLDSGFSGHPGHVYEVYYDAGSGAEKVKTVARGCGDPSAGPVCFQRGSGIAWVEDPLNVGVYHFLLSDGTVDPADGFGANNRVYLSIPNSLEVMAGKGGDPAPDGSDLGDDGLAVDASLASPMDVAASPDGGFYTADLYHCYIRKVDGLDPATAKIYSIGGACGDTSVPDTGVKSAFEANLWPYALENAPGGLYVADPFTGQIQLFDRTHILSGPPAFTNATSASFQFEALDSGTDFVCKVDNGANQACTAPFDVAGPLSEAVHTLRVCAAADNPDLPPTPGPIPDCADNSDQPQPDPTPAIWSWRVDLHAPTGLALGEPADGATGLSPTPTFTWQKATDSSSGIDHYELVIDGTKVADVQCSASPCSTTAPSALSEATHTWKVRALDKAGNAAPSEERKFDSVSPPTAAFTIAPNPVLVGRSVTFDGSGSSDAGGPIKRYEWDLDGDNNFETDGGTSPTTTKSFSTPGTVKVGLRVTDGVGLTTVATNTVTVTAPSLGNEIGVTINDGAQYTNKPGVTLSVVSPVNASDLLISNDGGFLAAKTFTVAKQIPWTLDSSGPERLPKTVYLRFRFGGFSSPNYTDDIILDETPPVVQQATVAPATAAAARAAALKAWKVKVKASDSNSGVGGIQVTASKRKPGKLMAYKRKLKVKSATRPRFLRAKDRAGNYSPWKKLR